MLARLNKSSLWFFLAIGIFALGLWLVDIVKYINYPQMEYSEGLIMFVGRSFAAGPWTWQIAAVPPYAVPFYPPVYYSILGGLINAFGDSLVVARAINLVMVVFICILLFLIVKRFTGRNLMAGIAALLPLTQPVFMNWSLIARVDMMAVMFELVAVLIVVKSKMESRLFALSIPFLLLAFYTKQSMVGGALAICICVMVNNWRIGLKYAGALIGSGLLVFVVAILITSGGFFSEVVLYQRTVPTFKTFTDSFLMVGYAPLSPFLVLAVIFFAQFRKSLPGIFALVAISLNLFANFRLGSSEVYMIEMIVAICLAAGLMIERFFTLNVLLIIVPSVMVITVSVLAHSAIDPAFPGPEYKRYYAEAESTISDATYPILAENVGLVLDAGKEPYLCDPFVFYNLNKLGYWREKTMVEDLVNGRIEYVVADRTFPRYSAARFSPDVQQAVMDNYYICYASPGASLPDNDTRSANQVVVYKARGEKR